MREPRLWPTPTVAHAVRGNHEEPIEKYQQRVKDYEEGRAKGKPGKSLGVAVRMWPTPRASSAMVEDVETIRKRGKYRGKLEEKVAFWPTPQHQDHKHHPKNALNRKDQKKQLQLTHAVGLSDPKATGQLNPTWVEWLMGFPTGYSELKPSETQ